MDINKTMVVSENDNFIGYINQHQNLTSKEKEVLFNLYNKKYSYITEFDVYDNSQLFNQKNSK